MIKKIIIIYIVLVILCIIVLTILEMKNIIIFFLAMTSQSWIAVLKMMLSLGIIALIFYIHRCYIKADKKYNNWQSLASVFGVVLLLLYSGNALLDIENPTFEEITSPEHDIIVISSNLKFPDECTLTFYTKSGGSILNKVDEFIFDGYLPTDLSKCEITWLDNKLILKYDDYEFNVVY